MDTSPLRKHLLNILILLNIAAVFTGAWYYWDQLSVTPLHLLIFVPDCPLYVLLALPILLKLIKNNAYAFIVSIGMVKYGLWTVFVLLFHWNAYSVPSVLPVTIVFLLGHIGMALEGAVLLPKKRVSAAVLLLALAWFLFNDYADYVIGTVPPIPIDGMQLVAALTVAASIIIPLAFYFYSEKIRNFVPIKLGRWLIQN